MHTVVFIIVVILAFSVALVYQVSKKLLRAVLYGILTTGLILCLFLLFLFVNLWLFQAQLADDLIYVRVYGDGVTIEGSVNGLFVESRKNLTLYLHDDAQEKADFFVAVDRSLLAEALQPKYDFTPYLSSAAPITLAQGETDTMIGLLASQTPDAYLEHWYNVSAQYPQEMQLQFALMAVTAYYQHARFSDLMRELNSGRLTVEKQPLSLKIVRFMYDWGV